MTPDPADTTIEQTGVVVPDIPIKELLDAIPSYCFKRSALRSSIYIFQDLAFIASFYYAFTYIDSLINPETLTLPYPFLYQALHIANWSLYGFWTGLFATGIWIVGHECGHQAFSDSKFLNNSVGWVLHSSLGVPYQAWRITHAKHHASTSHMTQEQVFVPRTRSELGLAPFDPSREDILGARVTEEVRRELFEALGDSPLYAAWLSFSYLIAGWIMYIVRNASGQRRYPVHTNHFNPSSVLFKPQQRTEILISNLGIIFWLTAVAASIYYFGFANVFRLYLVPYLWVNHWLVLITFLQHTDPLLPHYRAPVHTFPRGALATFDRQLLGDLGPVMAWIGAFATHGISETHVAHHVASKIPHYYAWDATYALRKKVLGKAGLHLQGGAGGWMEMYRVFKECRFVEDEGDVVFWKNAKGLAKARPVFNDVLASDSGVDVDGEL